MQEFCLFLIDPCLCLKRVEENLKSFQSVFQRFLLCCTEVTTTITVPIVSHLWLLPASSYSYLTSWEMKQRLSNLPLIKFLFHVQMIRGECYYFSMLDKIGWKVLLLYITRNLIHSDLDLVLVHIFHSENAYFILKCFLQGIHTISFCGKHFSH